MWHATGEDVNGEIEWISEPCDWKDDGKDWEDGDMGSWEDDMMTEEEFMQSANEAADFFVTNFNGTAAEAFAQWCPDGECVTPAQGMVGETVNQAVEMFSYALEDESTKSVVSQLSQDLTNAFGEDFSPLQALTEMEHKERQDTVNAALGQVAEELAASADDWLSSFLGAYTEGEKNDGLERKGGRRLN